MLAVPRTEVFLNFIHILQQIRKQPFDRLVLSLEALC